MEPGRNFKDAMSSFNIDFIQMANEFYNTQPFFYDKNQLWWLWNDTLKKWDRVDDTDLMNKINDNLPFIPNTTSGKVKSEILESMKRVGRRNIPKEAPIKWVQFKDKAYSLNSGEIYDVKPNYFFTNPIPYELGTSEETPLMDKLFTEWVGKDNVPMLYEILAYCCYRDYPIHLIFCFIGCGRNGKSSFMKILNKFLGQDNICSTELDNLLGSRFESGKLYCKLACTLGETNWGVMSKTSLIKRLTGQDMVGYEFKGKMPFDGLNYAKIIISSNSLPTSEDTSEGFYRRWLIIEFPNDFPEGKDITKDIPDTEYQNLAKKCCKILPKILKDGYFTNQGNIEERKKKFIEHSNPFSIFLEKCCERTSVNYFLELNEFYMAYTYFLSINKKRIISRKEFYEALNNEGLFSRKTSKKINDGFQNGYWIETVVLKENWKANCANCANNHNSHIPMGNEVVFSAQLAQKSHKDIVHLKCSICGFTPCSGYNKRSQPVCYDCLQNLKERLEIVEEHI